MSRFAANLSMLFQEHVFLDRFEAAARAGFEAVEFLFPYAHEAQEIRQRLDRWKLRLVLHNLPAGDWAAGERGIACHPDRIAEFHDGVQRAISYAQVLGVDKLNCLIGKVPRGFTQQDIDQTVLGNLAYAARALDSANIQLLIEPINTFDIPGFYLHHTPQALALLEQLRTEHGVGNVRLQYDVYHAQRMEGELAQTLRQHFAHIGHIQIADNPGRHEPGSGEINYAFLLDHIDRLGYAGWVGCEYLPASTTEAGLDWRQRLCPAFH